MFRFFFLFLLICWGLPVSSQTWLPLQYDTLPLQQEFIATGYGDYHSNALPNNLTGRLLFGGFIDNAIKDKARDRQREVNRFGLDVHTEFEYRNYRGKLFGNEQWGWLVKAGAYATGGAAYSEDAFGLVFYGNESYLGQTVDLSGTSVTFTAYEKIGFGAINKRTKSSIALNIVNVSNTFKGRIHEGELRQAEDASDIALSVDGDFTYTDRSRFSNGIGLAADLDFRIPITWMKGQTAYIQVMAKNLGFAYMNGGMQSYSVDSTYHYSGFDFDQLTGDRSVFSADFSVLDSLGIASERGQRVMLLPGFIQAGKIIDDQHTGAWQSFFGIRLYPTLPSNPMLYAGANWRPLSWLNVGLSGCYNGVGTFIVGTYASLQAQSWTFGIGTEDAIGAVSRSGLGKSLNLRLRCKF